MFDCTQADSDHMRRIAVRTLVLLTCVVAANCGKSSPTGPDASNPPSGGGSGATGETSFGSDGIFDDNLWDTEVQVSGAGGTGGAAHLHYQNAANGDYRRITITANSAAGSGAAGQVAVFSIQHGSTYFPSQGGTVYSVGYSEDSILLSGGASSQYTAPALRQNGKLYTLVPGAGAVQIPEATWVSHSLNGLKQNDFRTLASAAEHPDFSASGSPIELGFMRLYVVPAGSSGGQWLSGIDNWRLTLYR
jgi:hypothetical protein